MAGKGPDRNPVAVSDLATADPRPGAAQAGRHFDRSRPVLGRDRRAEARAVARGRKRSSGHARMHDDDPFEPAVLVVACEGAAALHLQHETGEIISRVNAFLGFSAIGRIRIVQKPVRPSEPQHEAEPTRRCRRTKRPRLGAHRRQDRGRRLAANRWNGWAPACWAAGKPKADFGSRERDRRHNFADWIGDRDAIIRRQLSPSGVRPLHDPSTIR